MSRALVFGVAAAALAAVGVVELATVVASRRPVPVAVVAGLARIGRRLGLPAPPGPLAARLEAAGAPLGLAVGDVMAVKGGAALIALLGAVPLAAALPARLPVLATAVVPVAAFLAPDVWLGARARGRGRAMELELPDMLDLLRVSLGAGLPLQRALAEVARRHRGRLAREWARAAAELELGAPSERVLDELAARCPTPGMPALSKALVRAGRHGTPLADALAAQAHEARTARARRVREDAARAAPKIQLVVALLLVPSVLLLVAAALLATFAR